MTARGAFDAGASEAWRSAADLLRGWLGVLAPPSGLAQVFGDLGFPSASTQDASETPHFRQFATALREFADWYGQSGAAPLDMTEIIALWFEGIRMQVDAVATTLASEGDVLSGWFESQSRPILGPARESHARWAAVARAGGAQLRALRSLQRVHLEVLVHALERCLARLRDPSLPKIGRLRALFREWSECVDETYRARALTPEYAAAFGECVNAGSALHLAWQTWQSGMPGAPQASATRRAATDGSPRTPPVEKSTDAIVAAPETSTGETRSRRSRTPSVRSRARVNRVSKAEAAREESVAERAHGGVRRSQAGASKPGKPGRPGKSKARAAEFDIARIGRPEGR
ncbi:MAG: poly(R)-hydroxyalkanoic acid synthase subunit PhaE [Gammaproteobacteria bacterium]